MEAAAVAKWLARAAECRWSLDASVAAYTGEWNATSLQALAMERSYIPYFMVPRQSVWLYVDGTFAHLSTVEYLQAARNISTAIQCEPYDGMFVDGGPWEWPKTMSESQLTDLSTLFER